MALQIGFIEVNFNCSLDNSYHLKCIKYFNYICEKKNISEEVYYYQGDRTLMWFSPNAEHLAFNTLNDSNVDDMVISRYNSPGTLNDQYPEVVSYKYPKVSKKIISIVEIMFTQSLRSYLHVYFKFYLLSFALLGR